MNTANTLRRLLTKALFALWIACPSPCGGTGEVRASDYFSREEIERASRFNRSLYVLFFCERLAAISFLALVAWSKLAPSYERDVEKLCRGRKRLALPVYAFFILVMIRLVILPFDAVGDLVVKGAYGLTTQTASSWLFDQIKSFMVADLWYVPFVMLIYATMRRLRRTWWLVSAAVLGVGLIAWYSFSPHLIEPLFYRITPVRSQILRGKLEPLFEKSQIPRTALYQADAGKKTTRANAYLSGLFLGRRIVLYNVLAKRAGPSEVEFVVAHEIGHWKNNHIIKGIGWGTAGAAACLLVTGILLKLTAGRSKKEQSGRYLPSSLPAFFFWLHVIAFLSMPIASAISRHFERSADRYAVELTQNPEGAVSLFQRIARRNIADLNPPPIAKLWLYGHPPVLERIGEALRMGGKAESKTTPPQSDAAAKKVPSAGERSAVTPGKHRADSDIDGVMKLLE